MYDGRNRTIKKKQKKKQTRRFGELKTQKYMGILEADIIKYVEMKEKNKKRIPQENGKTTRNQTK